MKGGRRRVSRDVGHGDREGAPPEPGDFLMDPKSMRRRTGVRRGDRVETPSWEKDRASAPKRRSWAPVVAVGVLAAGALIAGLLLRGGNGEDLSRSADGAGQPGVLQGPRRSVSGLTAREVAEAFLEAESREERLQWVRKRTGLEERLAEFPPETTAFPVRYEQLVPLRGVRTAEGMEFEQFAIRMGGGGTRLMCLVGSDDGFRVDWESFARCSTAGWDELSRGSVAEAEVRVFVKPEDYYLFDYADESRWTSFHLSSPDWPESLTGYAERGSTTAELLGRSADAGGPGVRVTLRVRPGATPGRKQVEVVRVLAGSWVVGDGDFEASFEARRERQAE